MVASAGRSPASGPWLASGSAAPAREVVVVDAEAAVEAVAAGEDDRRDHGGGVVAGGAQARGDGVDVGAEGEGAVVAHAVARRVEAGEDGGVAGQGDRRRGVAAGEADAAAGQRVEVGGVRPAPAVGAEVVGAGGVEGDEDEVGARLLRRAGRRRRRGRSGRRKRRRHRGGEEEGEQAEAAERGVGLHGRGSARGAGGHSIARPSDAGTVPPLGPGTVLAPFAAPQPGRGALPAANPPSN